MGINVKHHIILPFPAQCPALFSFMVLHAWIYVDVIMNLFKGNPFNLFFTHFEQKEDAWNEIKLVGLKDYLERIYQGVNVEYALLKLQNDDFLPAFDELVLKNNIDLIVVNTHRRSIFMRLFSPSMARKMLFHSDTPILAVRN